MSRELQEKADIIIKELKEILVPLSSEIEILKYTEKYTEKNKEKDFLGNVDCN